MGDSHHELTNAIQELTHVMRDANRYVATQNAIHQLEDNLLMKLSEIKNVIATSSKSQKEALQEIGSQIADLKQQIDDLKTAATDPDVTDADFLQQITTLQTDAQALADIVPGSPSTGPVTDGTGATPDRRTS
jgi:chromosome segregation ATPase